MTAHDEALIAVGQALLDGRRLVLERMADRRSGRRTHKRWRMRWLGCGHEVIFERRQLAAASDCGKCRAADATRLTLKAAARQTITPAELAAARAAYDRHCRACADIGIAPAPFADYLLEQLTVRSL